MQQFITIFAINLLTSIDNAIILGGISNRYKNLFLIGLVSSFVLTVARTILIMGIVSVAQWPGFRFTLGLVVLVIAINLAYVKNLDSRQASSFWRVLFLVVMTDVALSVDNVLSIALVSRNPFLLALSIFLSLVPLLLLLPLIVRVMNQMVWLRILAAGFVAELAIDSITDDPWLVHRVPSGRFEIILRVSFAVVVMVYGFWRTYVLKRSPTSL